MTLLAATNHITQFFGWVVYHEVVELGDEIRWRPWWRGMHVSGSWRVKRFVREEWFQ